MTLDSLRAALAVEKNQGARTRTLAVRLNPTELDRVAAVASREGLATATLARVIILAAVAELEREWERGGPQVGR